MTRQCLFFGRRAATLWRSAASLLPLWLLLLAALSPTLARAQDADCADVQIVIEQKVSLERQAFDAHMVIHNGLEGSALTNVKIELTYLDQDQQPVTATTDPTAVGATFFESLDQTSGITAIDGTGNLPAQSTADIHWLIIPSQGAGGDTADGLLYYIGAKVTYTLNGQTATVNVTPDYVVVRPQPMLVLDYFLPSDVYGDDPFTPQVEPPVPFTLGVRIVNVGAGTAVQTKIDSAQPQIVDNQQGLLIDFQILGGYVGNQPEGKSLLLDFGDIPSQQAEVGRWIMQTTLSGQFTKFDATYTHADSLGGAVTSLIQSVTTHTLVHDVLIDLAGHDDISDFLAEAGAGVRVFDSQGGDSDVINVSGSSNLASVGNGNLRLTFTPAPNLVWAKVKDPFNGAKSITNVVRSDGKVLPSQNYWLSKTRNDDLSWSYYIQIFDSNTTGDYELVFSQGSTTASLSGQAYLDANANGVRDAGEAAESNLPITLKGVDQQGSNVLVSAYTDPSGAFSFGSLAPGTYQLQAASVNGQVDGVWVAGSAGGTAQPGSITGITLMAGTAAQGYLIAKQSPTAVSSPGTQTADLSIALKAARSQLRGGESTTVTATVRNAGQNSAQAVVAQVAVPAGLTLQNSSATSGNYANNAWNIGDLAQGQDATLTLTVEANRVSGNQNATVTWPASVTSQTPDPQSANNSDLLGLTVLADDTSEFELTQSLPAYANVLMLMSCPAEVAATRADCESTAVNQAQTRFAPLVHKFTPVTDLAAWRAAVRSGAYDLLWLHGGAGKLDTQQLEEIRAAVRRGSTLVVDGQTAAEQAGAPQTDLLADVLGGKLALPALGSGQAVNLPNEPSAQGAAGSLYAIDALADNAYVMAQGPDGSTPVMANHPFGLGQAWLVGIDLLQSLDPAQSSAASFWNDYLGQQIQSITPAGSAAPALAGSPLAVKATARSDAADGDPAQSVSLRMNVPNGVTYENAIPAPTQAQAGLVQWDLQLAPAQSGSGELTLILPQATASLQLQTSLLDSTNQNQLNSQTLPIQVLDLDTLTPQVDAELSALSTSDAATQTLIDQAKGFSAAAKAAQTASSPDWDAALTALASLQARLTQLSQPPYNLSLDELALDAARWIGLAQSHWQAANSGTPGATQVVIKTGDGQSAIVNTPFTAPLVAQALDAQGTPVSGVVVHFSLPAAGASAQFAGGTQTADVSTDTQGLATSPALTANATVGSYQAGASIDGVTQAAGFALTNLPPSGGSGKQVYTVTPSVSGAGGAISPTNAVSVQSSSGTTFALTPTVGYVVSSVGGTCGGTLNGNIYATKAVTTNCTVIAKFAQGAYAVTPSVSGIGGTISPASSVSVKGTATTSFTLKPAAGYVAGPVNGSCGGTLSGNTYKTNPITAPCTVVATFIPGAYTVTPSVSGAGGAINPTTGVSVAGTSTTTFTLTPSAGYVASSVGGTCGGTLNGNTYTTKAITANCTVIAKFAQGTYVVAPSVSGAGGTISPASGVSVKGTATTSFTLKPSAGYAAGTVGGTCGGTLSGNTYKTNPITAPCTVVATFVAGAYTVTPSVSGTGGAINPATGVSIQGNSTTTFTLTPSAGYVTSSVGGTCGGTLDGNTYTTKAITANCTVIAKFAQGTYAVTPSVSGTGGTISPASNVSVKGTATTSFTLKPAAGYAAGAVGGTCGGTLSGNTYKTNPITAPCTVVATFTPGSYTITPSLSGTGGTFSPETTAVLVPGNSTAKFTLTPFAGYVPSSVGGTCGGTLSGNIYTTKAITGNCTINFTFTLGTYTVTPSVNGSNGTISPLKGVSVKGRATTSFTLKPSAGYTAFVGGTCSGALSGSTYTTDPITANCTVVATFMANSNSPTFKYETQPIPDATSTSGASDLLALLNQEGAKGYFYQEAGEGTSSATFVNDGSGQTYNYELIIQPDNTADFVTQANTEGARGYHYEAGDYLVATDAGNANYALYRRDSGSSAVYTYAADPFIPSVADFLTQANQRGQAGYWFYPYPPRAMAAAQNLYIKNNASTATYTYDVPVQATSVDALLAQLNNEGGNGYRALFNETLGIVTYVKDQSQSAIFGYQSSATSPTIDLLNSYGAQGYAYWSWMQLHNVPSGPAAAFYIKPVNCSGWMCSALNPALE
jgi:hypothetical protein